MKFKSIKKYICLSFVGSTLYILYERFNNNYVESTSPVSLYNSVLYLFLYSVKRRHSVSDPMSLVRSNTNEIYARLDVYLAVYGRNLINI